MPINQNHLTDQGRKIWQYIWKVLGFIQRRNNDTDTWGLLTLSDKHDSTPYPTNITLYKGSQKEPLFGFCFSRCLKMSQIHLNSLCDKSYPRCVHCVLRKSCELVEN